MTAPFAEVRAAAAPLTEPEYRAQRIAEEIAHEASRALESVYLGECSRKEAARELMLAAGFAVAPSWPDRKSIIRRACRLAWDDAEINFSDAAAIISAEIEQICANGGSDLDATEIALDRAEAMGVHWRLVLPLVREIAPQQRMVRARMARHA